MLDYNSNNIFVGYIKQLLSSFNYPDVDVYSYRIIPLEGHLYLKDQDICLYSNQDFIKKVNYNEQKEILNITKKFKNNTFIYDEHTHIWLGKYLRFLRDYKNIDLMSMYNFFTNSLAENVNISTSNYTFDSKDSNYKIYSIPIYLFEKYSIYIASNSKVEFICTFNRDVNSSEESTLRNLTYKKVGSPKFEEPIIFDSLYISNLRNVPSIYERNNF